MKRFLLGLMFYAAIAPAVAEDNLSGILATEEQRAEIFRKAEQWDELDKHARAWADADIGNWQPWYYLGIALTKKNDIQSAVGVFSQAVKLSPPDNINDDLQIWLAHTYASLENFAAAEVAYRRLLEDNKNHPVLWGKLREVIAAQDGEDKRRQESEVLAQLLTYAVYINDYELWKRQAQLLEQIGDLSGARNAQENKLRLMPSDLAAAEWAYRYDIEQGDAEKIQAGQKRLLRLNRKHPVVNVHLGDEALRANKTRLAKRYYELALGDNHYRREQAHAITKLADFESAASPKTFNKYFEAIKTYPEYLPAWEKAIVSLHHLGQRERASLYLSRFTRVKRYVKDNKPLPSDILDGL